MLRKVGGSVELNGPGWDGRYGGWRLDLKGRWERGNGWDSGDQWLRMFVSTEGASRAVRPRKTRRVRYDCKGGISMTSFTAAPQRGWLTKTNCYRMQIRAVFHSTKTLNVCPTMTMLRSRPSTLEIVARWSYSSGKTNVFCSVSREG